MKAHKALKIAAIVGTLLAVVVLCLPHYARQALIHLMPVIDDLDTFEKDTVCHNPDNVWQWPLAERYNSYQLSAEDKAYLDSLGTVSFLIIRHDSLLFEDYRNGWNDTLTSNIYSDT